VHGLEIELDGNGKRYIWRYESLSAGEPLRRNAIDVLLSSSEQPGASLFVQGPDFATRLKDYAPHLTAKAERWRNAKPWIACAAAIVAAIALIYAAGWSPMKSIASVLPESWRQRLGDEARLSMTEGYKKCVDEAGLAALAKLAERLSKGAETAKPFKITVYDWQLTNAFAVPGGQVVLTKGLIGDAKSADEVAGVLAHEMGHGLELHPETGIIRAIGLAAAMELMMGGSSGALANIGVLLAQLGYTRAAEREADMRALELLKAAAISPKGLGDFFQRIDDSESDDKGRNPLQPFSILRTHPPTAERAALVRKQAAYPATPALDERSWQELKAICRKTVAEDRGQSK
jgi:predicted Zn-dependent protease